MGSITRSFANNILTSGKFDAAQLNGTLPALDGSSLTGLSPDYELLSNTSISAAGVVEITTAFTDTTYTNFFILGSGINMVTDNNSFRYNFINNSGGIVADTNYYWAGVGQRDTGSAVDFGASGTSYGLMIDNNSNTGQSINFTMTVYKPYISGHFTSFVSQAGGRRSGGGANHVNTGGYINTSDQVKGIRFLMGSGNISAGNLFVFGIRDS